MDNFMRSLYSGLVYFFFTKVISLAYLRINLFIVRGNLCTKLWNLSWDEAGSDNRKGGLPNLVGLSRSYLTWVIFLHYNYLIIARLSRKVDLPIEACLTDFYQSGCSVIYHWLF